MLNFQVQAEPIDTYTELEWVDLVPRDWEPPILQPDPTEDPHVDPKSLVAVVHQQDIKLPGFMQPVKFSGNSVSEFVLVPFLKHHVKTHRHHAPNQMIYVTLAQPLTVTNAYQPIWVSGKMLLKSVDTEEGLTGYTLENAMVEAYIY